MKFPTIYITARRWLVVATFAIVGAVFLGSAIGKALTRPKELPPLTFTADPEPAEPEEPGPCVEAAAPASTFFGKQGYSFRCPGNGERLKIEVVNGDTIFRCVCPEPEAAEGIVWPRGGPITSTGGLAKTWPHDVKADGWVTGAFAGRYCALHVAGAFGGRCLSRNSVGVLASPLALADLVAVMSAPPEAFEAVTAPRTVVRGDGMRSRDVKP